MKSLIRWSATVGLVGNDDRRFSRGSRSAGAGVDPRADCAKAPSGSDVYDR